MLSFAGNKVFLNKKYYGVGKATVRPHWDAIVAAVEGEGFACKRIPEEYCVYDDHPEIDDPWEVLPADCVFEDRQFQGAVHSADLRSKLNRENSLLSI